MQRFKTLGLGLGCALILAAPTMGQHEKPKAAPKGGDEAKPAAKPEAKPQGKPEGKPQDEGDAKMDQMMADMMKYATPGENHEHLKPLAGRWKLTTKFRMSPEGEWEDSVGDSTMEWILGGRFLQQKVKSPPCETMPMEFEGFGLLGYDNYGKKFVSMWADSMTTNIMMMTGSSDPSGKTITFTGEMDDCMTGKKSKQRWVYKISGDDTFTFEMYGPDESGQEFLGGEITYNRVK